MMSNAQPSGTKPARLERYVLILAITWTIVMAGLLAWNVRQADDIAQDIARHKAQLYLNVAVLLAREQQTLAVEVPSLGLLWLLGLAAIGLAARSLLHHARERDRAEAELSQHRTHLEEMVQERTIKLTHINEQLQVEIAERKRAEEEQRALRQALGQRVKELDCLYSIAALIEKAHILKEVLQGVADLMPSGWQYPEIACARIVLRDQELKTENYRETAWRQSGDIVVRGEQVGTLDVCYLEEMPARDEGPFLKEERKLLAAIAERLGRVAERIWAEAALEERIRFETLLADLSATLVKLPAGEVDRAIQQGLQHIVELLDVDRAALSEFSESQTELHSILSYTRPGLPAVPARLTSEKLPWYFEKLRRGEMVVAGRLDDMPADATRDKQSALEMGVKSNLTIPLTIGGVNLGMISLGSFRHERAWPRDLIPRLKLIGEIFASAYARKRAEETLHQQNEYLAALQETTLDLISRLNLDNLLENIVKRAGQLLGTAHCYLDLIEPGTSRLKPKVGRGALRQSLEFEVQPGEGVAGMVWQTGRPFVIDDYDAWPDRIQSYSHNTLRTVIGVPLLSDSQVMGVLGLAYDWTTNRAFGQQSIELLEQFARLAVIAIENARLFEQTQQDAQTKAELLKEVNHRVKNSLVAILGLLLAEKRYTPAKGRSFVEPAIDGLSHRIEGLLEVHQMLSESEWAPMRLSDLATRIVHAVLNAVPPGRHVVVDISPSPIDVSPRQASNLALVINELATNTVKYALERRETARIAIRAAMEGDMICIEYRDDGPGYPQEMLRLERYNVGLYLLQTLVTHSLRGTLTLANDGGAVAIMHIKVEEKERT
jgi:two-component sensor histidine kinase